MTPPAKTIETKPKRGRTAPDDATRMAKAVSHPLRTKILVRLNERVASPNELSKEFEEPLGNVSYHVRALLDLDCIELVDTAQRRGALEHYYRAVRRPIIDDDSWGELPPSVRHGFAVEWFKKTFGDVGRAIDAGRFETRSDAHLTFTPLILDEQAWKELAVELTALLERGLELQAESAGRRHDGDANGEGDEIAARLVLMQYEGPPPKRRARKR